MERQNKIKMENNDKLIDMARALGRAIQMDDRFKDFMAARTANDENEALQAAIGRFEMAKMNLNSEVGREKPDKDKIQSYNIEMQQAYDEVMSSEGMQRYSDTKNVMEGIYNWITSIIATAVNGGDPDTVEEPASGCTGSCETCGGCH